MPNKIDKQNNNGARSTAISLQTKMGLPPQHVELSHSTIREYKHIDDKDDEYELFHTVLAFDISCIGLYLADRRIFLSRPEFALTLRTPSFKAFLRSFFNCERSGLIISMRMSPILIERINSQNGYFIAITSLDKTKTRQMAGKTKTGLFARSYSTFMDHIIFLHENTRSVKYFLNRSIILRNRFQINRS